MSVSYAKAHREHLTRRVAAKGGDFAALYDVSRWYNVPPKEAALIAGDVGLLLTQEQCDALRGRHESEQELAALVRGEAPKGPALIIKTYGKTKTA